MGQTIARCVDCGRLFKVEHEGTPPSRENLVCECGAEQFETVSVEQLTPADTRVTS